MYRLRQVLGAIVVIFAAVAVIASCDDNNAGPAMGDRSAAVGDEVKLVSWSVKVWGVTDPYPPSDQSLKPKDGFRWVSVDTEVKNLSRDPSNVSSSACFTVQDFYKGEFPAIIADAQPGLPGGEVAPNASKRGNIVFELPTDATHLALSFKCDFSSVGAAAIQLRPPPESG